MKFGIIGLGYFGRNLARTLTQMGAEVLACDCSEDQVNAIKDSVSMAMILDAANLAALRNLPWADMDAVVVAIGENFEANVLATAHLQELGVKRLICRAINPVHEKILRLMQVHEVVLPESLAAHRMARTLVLRGGAHSYDLATGFDIVEAPVPASLVGKSLAEAELRARHKLNLVTIKRTKPKGLLGGGGDEILGIPEPTYRFVEGDRLILFGEDRHLRDWIDRS